MTVFGAFLARSFAGLFIMTSFCFSSAAADVQKAVDASPSVDGAAQRAVVATLVSRLNQSYVFPDVARRIDAALQTDLKNGEFEKQRTSLQFAALLTDKVRAVSNDKHLAVRFSPEPARKPANQSQADELRRMQRGNFAVSRVERFEHNIGYIGLRGFEAAKESAATIAAMMRLVAYTDALIIDLRENGGGYPDGVVQLQSYFFDKPTHLYDFQVPKDGTSEQVWTSREVAGPRYGQTRDVFVLTSRNTFSGGEDMAYTLQQLKRATIVGETTGGGANAGDSVTLGSGFTAFIPAVRPVNAISKDNWEGRGVVPDVSVPADQALRVARIMALRKAAALEADSERRKDIENAIVELDSGASASGGGKSLP